MTEFLTAVNWDFITGAVAGALIMGAAAIFTVHHAFKKRDLGFYDCPHGVDYRSSEVCRHCQREEQERIDNMRQHVTDSGHPNPTPIRDRRHFH